MIIFELRTVQASAWRGLWEVLKEILTDITLRVDQDGIKLTAIDGSRVLVHLRLPAVNFEYFHCSKSFSMGLNCASVFRLLKSLSATDCVKWLVHQDNPNLLCMVIENVDKNLRTEYWLKLLDLDEDHLTIPEFNDTSAVINIACSELQRVIRDMYALSPTIRITMLRTKQLALSCRGTRRPKRPCWANTPRVSECNKPRSVTLTDNSVLNTCCCS